MILEDFHLFHIAKNLENKLKDVPFTSIKFYKNNLLFEGNGFVLFFLSIDDFSVILKLNRVEFTKILKIKNMNFSELDEISPPFKVVEIGKTEDERVIYFKIFEKDLKERNIFFHFIPHNTFFKIDSEIFKSKRRKLLDSARIDFTLPKDTLKKEILKNVKFTSPIILKEFLKGDNISKEKLNFLIDKFYSSKIFYLSAPYEIRGDTFKALPKNIEITPLKPLDDIFFVESDDILYLLKIYAIYYIKYKHFYQLKQKVLKSLKKRLNDIEKKIFSLNSQIKSAKDYEKYKQWGDIISANLYLFNGKKRSSKINLTDFSGKEIEIPLDSQKTILENKDFFYKKYSKLKRAMEKNPERVKRLEKDRLAFTKLISEVEDTYELNKIEQISHKFGISTKEKKSLKDKKKVKFRKFITSDGYVVLVGRGAKENDELTFRYSSPNDLWFHVADYSGSHVILIKKSRKKSPPFSSILEAAKIAAYYSKSPKGDLVDVRWTLRKHVLKIKGTPGLVRLREFNTLRVLPELPSHKNWEETK